MITETKENQTQTGLKNFKPKINLNHNIDTAKGFLKERGFEDLIPALVVKNKVQYDVICTCTGCRNAGSPSLILSLSFFSKSATLQNTGPLIYILLNRKSAYVF